MTVVAIGSVKGSPGATTTMLALAAVWPADRPLLLAEADPDGGVLAARARLKVEPGIRTLAAAGRHQLAAGDLDKHVQQLPGPVPALVSPPDPDEAARAIGMLAPRLAVALEDIAGDVLIDVGRIRFGSPANPLIERAHTVVVACRPHLDELAGAVPRVRSLTDAGTDARLLLVGERPYGPDLVASELGMPVLGAVADDPGVAGMLAGLGGRGPRLRRSQLVRSAPELVERLLDSSGAAPHTQLERQHDEHSRIAGVTPAGMTREGGRDRA